MQDFFLRYLASKKSVDDRALNAHVWSEMAQIIKGPACRVLEIGAGIGTMIERLDEHGLLETAVYHAIDNDPEHILICEERLRPLIQKHRLTFEATDLLDFIQQPQQIGQYDLILAHAFLDLMDIPAVLPDILALLKPGGHFYFTINFDGGTIFEPSIDPQFDALVENLYHQTMDERVTDGKLSGDSKSGRHLFHHIQDAGGQVTAAGSSDWVVFGINGRYPADEAFFLHTILGYFENSLKERPELDNKKFNQWLQTRRQQIENGTLVYIAHQLDLFGQV
ncbi:MAG: class I SAM-dependent methyltransferase [Chloroflexota bacterium]